MEKKEVVLHIRADVDLKADLQSLADADERKLSPFITRILRQYVDQERRAGRLPEPAKKTRPR
jgi:predicted transcriptional regulator